MGIINFSLLDEMDIIMPLWIECQKLLFPGDVGIVTTCFRRVALDGARDFSSQGDGKTLYGC